MKTNIPADVERDLAQIESAVPPMFRSNLEEVYRLRAELIALVNKTDVSQLAVFSALTHVVASLVVIDNEAGIVPASRLRAVVNAQIDGYVRGMADAPPFKARILSEFPDRAAKLRVEQAFHREANGVPS